MGFFSFLGRVLFASIFILSAWQMFNEFGDDGGPAVKEVAPKLVGIQKFVASKLGESVTVDARNFVAASIALKGLGGLLFVFSSTLGAYLLIVHLLFTAPILYDFYNYKFGEPEFLELSQEFLQCVSFVGALLIFLGMKTSIVRRQLRKKNPKSKTS
ncbi:hypothetical protein Leryth_024770 [Lithospermum erythrorhizon]|nr:hypothetical protein Leryth_024770 [Lithospermum erythrorhizon]